MSEYRLAYLLAAVVIVVFELAFNAVSQSWNLFDSVTLLALCALLAVAPWVGIGGDLLYIGPFALLGATSVESALSFPVSGLFLITTVWISHHHAIRAIL